MRFLEEFGTLMLILGFAVAMGFLIMLARILATYTNFLITIIGIFAYVSILGIILWILDKRSKI
ncbi:hypothetical protein K1720_08260 [Thermococcus argininiproducens]|uniref:Uncharacterized protein n=1 Tax=Thermococcus argininiproducens TaxID=2866384 RepID=A0A9E7SC73_9EURY|nr:hypothetical protein [Thermococcus argininiproducens]USG99500.1 hypothetical protein K1720_08260 [Thermococcus argininiproducens]